MMLIVRRAVLLLVLGPPFLFLLVSGVTFVPFGMACVNWMMGGEGGFWNYFNEVRKELPEMFMEDARKAWSGIDKKKDAKS